ncbi:MAG: hypothetical protein IT334_04435 [Thermomicrobiales bacterium]|nr:hypothetical protein [Thermomicrobiales bacterium]
MSDRLTNCLSSAFLRVFLISLLLLTAASPVAAAPEAPAESTESAQQSPGWMTQDILNRLMAVGAPVLAPSYLPGAVPFLPSVDAWSGYYSFYWLVPGAPPTYLQVTGTVGGGIPAYSKYDRNVELTQNATVLGYPAWHDLTPIYDLVYFAIGNVVYTVESNNLGESSLGIADALMYVDVPVYQPEPTPAPGDSSSGGGTTTSPTTPDSPDVVETDPGEPAIVLPESVISEEMIVVGVRGVVWANLEASAGTFTLTDRASIDGVEPSSFEWIAPRTQRGRNVRFTLTDPSTGDVLVTETLRIEPIPDDQIPVDARALSCPVSIPMGSLAGIEIDGSGQLTIDASDGVFPDVGPNRTFAGAYDAEVSGTDVLPGVIRTNRNAWVFLEAVPAPAEYTTYIFLQNRDGVTLLECGISVVFADPDPEYPEMDPQDGTGAVGGLGFAVTSGVPEGTSIQSSDFPGVGFLNDGSIAYLESIPFSDGTTVSQRSTTDPEEATPSAGP